MSPKKEKEGESMREAEEDAMHGLNV